MYIFASALTTYSFQGGSCRGEGKASNQLEASGKLGIKRIIDFDRLPVRVSGVAKHSFLGSALHSCFWPERVADYILQSKELAKCDQQE